VNELSLIIHVSLAAILVGPQLLMFLAVTPASWLIGDHELRTQVVRVIARRFAVLSVFALIGLLLTGLYQLYNVTPDIIREDMTDYRFGVIFMIKMTLFLLLIAMIAFHGAVLARRMARVTEELRAGRAEAADLEGARRNSMLFSGLMVLVSFAILAMGVLLGNPQYSYV
jgi:putative copper export protein